MLPNQISRRIELWALATSFLLVILMSLWRFGFGDNFDSVLLSDSGVSSENVLEDLQTIVLIMALVTSIYIVSRAQRSAWRRYFLVVSVGLLLVTLDELAFGQHALDLEAPDFVKNVNAQNDITLHNLEWIQDSYVFFGGRYNLLFVIPVLLSLLLSLTWLVTKSQRFGRYWPAVPGLAPIPLFLFCFMIHVIFALSQSRLDFLLGNSQAENSVWAIRVIDWELGELSLYLGLLIWLITVASSIKRIGPETGTIAGLSDSLRVSR